MQSSMRSLFRSIYITCFDYFRSFQHKSNITIIINPFKEWFLWASNGIIYLNHLIDNIVKLLNGSRESQPDSLALDVIQEIFLK